jgi:hypothetical protein
MEQDAGSATARPRVRSWDNQDGFDNLFQGRDLATSGTAVSYPGDRAILGLESTPERLVVQVHRVVPRDGAADDRLLTLAIHLGDQQIVRRT